MKGRFELPQNMAIIMVGVGGVLLFLIMTVITLGTSVQILEKDIAQMNEIDATRIVEECFMQGEEIIHENFLVTSDGKDLCELCRICEVDAHAWIEDLESNREWKFRRKRNTDNSKVISIEMIDGEIHIGRLYVKV